MKPSWINKLGIGLGITRLVCYFLFQPHSRDALWQVELFPLWIADLPITLLYWWLPIPIGEAFIGPVWWYFLPQLIWWVKHGQFNRYKDLPTPSKPEKKILDPNKIYELIFDYNKCVTCPACNVKLKLDGTEIGVKQFECTDCKSKIKFSIKSAKE